MGSEDIQARPGKKDEGWIRIMVTINFGKVKGLPEEEQKKLDNLVEIFNYHQRKNERKQV